VNQSERESGIRPRSLLGPHPRALWPRPSHPRSPLLPPGSDPDAARQFAVPRDPAM